MTLRLYNTLTRTKEDFVPLDPKNVRMYVCGPTVYDFAHIGNARPAIVFDVLFRLLRHLYGAEHVKYVRNITDVDDKINARAADEYPDLPLNEAIRRVTEKTEKQYQEDVAALGCLPPTYQPRATENIDSMVVMNQRLIAAGHAYAAEGHVLYRVASKADYGKLARRSLDEMMAGARVEIAPYKENPMDFVLWKPSTPEQPGWDSPWGRGRPGWHIECSAMSETFLGETFDIHGGGIDLVFPHHENEIAQSEGAHHGHKLAQVWMHNGFLQVEGEKMSKSLGNFVTIRELMRGWGGYAWSGAAIRLTMLKTHYRQPINWSLRELDLSRNELADWVRYISLGRAETESLSNNPQPSKEVLEALCDDLNMAEAIKSLRQQFSKMELGNAEQARLLESDLRFLGILDHMQLGAYAREVTSPPGDLDDQNIQECVCLADNFKAATVNNDEKFQLEITEELRERNLRPVISHYNVRLERIDKNVGDRTIELLIAARNEARKAKNFKESDRIRDELLAKGIVLKDGPTGTTWEVKR
ncbi:MAG TPA: cysteine--tRNA ligase [Micropepsaceae bacterium]|nr:cysteine--tRNA ligase [Micropepsaceae bacterium]